MDLIDTHCHIQSIGAETGEDHTRALWSKNQELTPDSVIERAKDHNVSKMICVGCDLGDSQLAISYAKNRPSCYASIGLHPHEAKDYASSKPLQEEFAALATAQKVVAVGECGLDYFYNHSDKADQIKVLKFQIELALKHNLPLIFHVREAIADFWPIFESYSGIRGVLHSYTDDMANLNKAIAAGLYIGVNGIATFSKAENQLQMYKSIPLEHLLLETDSPYLTPTPYRGTINEPKRVGVIADFLSELRQESRESLARQTTANAIKLFNIDS